MEILEFRKIRLSDRYDKKYGAWSRIYEYPLVLDKIKEHNNVDNPKIHNTSWGFEGCHVTFKNDVDDLYIESYHSDIKPSTLPKTGVWDLTKEPNEEFVNNYDVVLNVSTMEEVKFNHITIFNNMLKQVKDGGILVCTFDLPGLQLEKFEGLFKQKIERFDDELDGSVSVTPNNKYEHLSCGLLVIRK